MRVALRAPIAGKLGEEFDRVFDRLLAPRLYNEPLLPPFPFETAGAEWMPVMDVIENAGSTSCVSRRPGSTRRTWYINLVGEILTITGKREMAPEVEGEGYLVRERVYGKFVRTIRLPVPCRGEEGHGRVSGWRAAGVSAEGRAGTCHKVVIK